ncbi:MAG: regulatory protein RecX [Bacteroidales bacterium]|nr:regulatory protein RecX [Bacteroidales bacterium]
MGKNKNKQPKKLEQYLNKAKNLCSKQEKCRSEILKKLDEWDASEEYHERIIEILLDEKYIDEVRYSSSFVRSKFRQNKWGRIKLKYALQQKNIPQEIIQEVIYNEIPEEAYEECLHQLLVNKNLGLKGDHKMKKLSKMISFGTNKGFEYEIVKSFSENILSK